MPDVRVYINAAGRDVPAGSTALDALRHANADEAAAVERGERTIVDSRGLPIESSARVFAGAIYRTTRAAREATSGNEPNP